jgi:hypothetical protein
MYGHYTTLQISADGDSACAKFRSPEERKGASATEGETVRERAARNSQYIDSRGGMMLVTAAPVLVHIVSKLPRRGALVLLAA